MNSAMLAFTIITPLLAGLVVATATDKRARSAALLGSFASLIPVAVALLQFDWSNAASFQGKAEAAWLPALGMQLAIGADGVAMTLIALSALLGPICVLASWTAITDRPRLYYSWLMILQAAMIGVFASRDLLLFYVCFEFTLLPMFVLIRVYGSTNRVAASTKFFLYTFTGSIIALAGLVYVVAHHQQVTGEWSLHLGDLMTTAREMSATQQGWVLAALLAGFAVKVPLFPVHTWLPLAHTEAPTAGSVVLAAVLLKLGTYGIYRFAMGFAPVAFVNAAPEVAVLAIVGIVYAGLICWVQSDIKKLVAYSSVSHLGFCVLGLLAVNQTGVTGSVLYMLSHGLSTGGLFLMIGMMYERYHTRDMNQVGGLASRMPIWASFMVFFAMASVGLPGLNGFPSELLCLIGTFQSDADLIAAGQVGASGGTLGVWYAVAAGTGMVIAAIYLLFMVGRICFGEYREPRGHHAHDELPTDLNAREIGLLIPLAAGCLLFGLYPKLLTDAIEAPIEQLVSEVQHAAELPQPAALTTEPATRPGDSGGGH
ncbi:MAG: NuoM family protein [Phycisphaerales bacterium JB040]